ncbi:recombinase family protein [Bradyrhizobium sp. dw_78]|uniref:recombinase family protein n=1 Tax=Bradyrhizobium sp. dw_78 TaxID=2719793 RepID=UPI001BD639DC|nr:recombinase family protein [Bradyrhizobium sp. dw_78]
MANSLVVCKGTNLAKRNKALRAAQYVRMSTDYQRNSIQNQAAATCAQQNNLTIVRTYVDEGRSGLRIKRRACLIELIDDVQSERADYDHILVYDVSRWRRFQDVDESAHYEFISKQNGINVACCAEQFDNDGSLLSSIIKNIKRVMAAEYSREISVKVHTGQCRIASLGYRVGGPLTFGLHRKMFDENQRSKGTLEKGQHCWAGSSSHSASSTSKASCTGASMLTWYARAEFPARRIRIDSLANIRFGREIADETRTGCGDQAGRELFLRRRVARVRADDR